jgi:bis(5'-nucleosyl)-tetraphosphatase (symmetrical)
MCGSFSGPPKEAPDGCRPWFDMPERRSRGETIIFGHWAALGLWLREGVAGLDSGCAWGRELTALRLEDGKLFQQKTVD